MAMRRYKKKLRFLVVSGPTREPLDPVRFISNYSTGTMGKYLVRAAEAGKQAVTWIRCPEDAETAALLFDKLKKILPEHDILIMAAAVCDVRPKTISKGKIKKADFTAIPLVKNPDILASLLKFKKKGQIFFGFGLESANILKNGLKKLREKGLELIVLQKVARGNTPFGDKNIEAVVLKKSGESKKFHSVGKGALARFLVREAMVLHSKISGVR